MTRKKISEIISQGSLDMGVRDSVCDDQTSGFLLQIRMPCRLQGLSVMGKHDPFSEKPKELEALASVWYKSIAIGGHKVEVECVLKLEAPSAERQAEIQRNSFFNLAPAICVVSSPCSSRCLNYNPSQFLGLSRIFMASRSCATGVSEMSQAVPFLYKQTRLIHKVLLFDLNAIVDLYIFSQTSSEKMGDPSDLRFVPSSCATTPIDWTKVPEASKNFLLERYGHYFEEDSDSDSEGGTFKIHPLPPTIEDLARMFNETKFFGYMTPEHCTLLLDISEFGLAKPRPNRMIIGPRFYMKYLEQIWFILFVPGYRDGITGHSPKIPYTEDSFEDTGIARDKALAEDYDVKLCEEVSRVGTLGAVACQKLAGWESSMVKSNMEDAQMAMAIMGLPTNHPARVNMIRSLWPSR